MAPEEARVAIVPYAELFVRPLEIVLADLAAYAAMLAKWQAVQNLVSRETLAVLWPRHIADSLQVLRRLGAGDRRVLDLGSGGGLPAIPMAIARLRDTTSTFTLVEPNARKASFLRTVGRTLELPIQVEARRAEAIDSRETFDLITSRALAQLPQLLDLAGPFFGPETRAVFHKGREYGEEIAKSRAHWQFDVLVVDSDTKPGSVLLEITNLRARTVS
jgi:16S rRNA (guanine527-N7)-methyltransferase